jgi:hypothetical protein
MDFGYPLVVIAAVLGLATYCGAHLILARISHTASPYPPLIGGFVPGLLAAGVATICGLLCMQATVADCCGYAVLNLVTYAALGWGYFHFVNLCIASLRIRVLEELVEQGGTASDSFLFSRYNDHQLIETRLARLVRGGHLAYHDGRYLGGNRHFLHVARLFEFLRWFVLGPKTTCAPMPAPRTSPSAPTAGRGSPLP